MPYSATRGSNIRMMQAWYAILVRSNFEHRTNTYLASNGYNTFLPTYREHRRWSDRPKQVDVPLFRGYVFCQMDVQQRLPIMQAPGVVGLVGFGNTFPPVPDEEIAAIRTIVSSSSFTRPHPYLSLIHI